MLTPRDQILTVTMSFRDWLRSIRNTPTTGISFPETISHRRRKTGTSAAEEVKAAPQGQMQSLESQVQRQSASGGG